MSPPRRIDVDTPEGPAVIVPSKPWPDIYMKRPAGQQRSVVWHLVEYPDGRRRYWNETAITVKP